MGKTGLIKNVFYYIKKENKSSACFYLDIFSTQYLQEFVSQQAFHSFLRIFHYLLEFVNGYITFYSRLV